MRQAQEGPVVHLAPGDLAFEAFGDMGECLLRFQSPTNAAAELATKGPPWQTTSPASDDAGCAGGALGAQG